MNVEEPKKVLMKLPMDEVERYLRAWHDTSQTKIELMERHINTVRLFKDGLTYAAIGGEVGISPTRVRQVLVKMQSIVYRKDKACGSSP